MEWNLLLLVVVVAAAAAAAAVVVVVVLFKLSQWFYIVSFHYRVIEQYRHSLFKRAKIFNL